MDIPLNNELYEPELSDISPQLPDLIDAIQGTTRSHNFNKSPKRASNWSNTEQLIVTLLKTPYNAEQACPCLSRQSHEVRFVDLVEYQTGPCSFCGCGSDAGQLACEGWFPSSPVQPGTVFSERLLDLLDAVSVKRPHFRYGFGKALRACLEKKHHAIFPTFQWLVSLPKKYPP